VDKVSRRISALRRAIISSEEIVATVSLLLLALLPVTETILRQFRFHIPDVANTLRHLVLPITFIGAAIASRNNQHLGIDFGFNKRPDLLGAVSSFVPRFFTAAIVTLFFFASVATVMVIPESQKSAWFVPLIIFFVFIPIGFLLMLYRYRPRRHQGRNSGLWIAYGAGVALGLFLAIPSVRDGIGAAGLNPAGIASFDETWLKIFETLRPFLLIALVVSAFLGTPLFVVLGGAAALLMAGEGYSSYGNTLGADGVINAAYSMISQEIMPAISLFTLTGFILSMSKSGERFVRFFTALIGPIPGGLIFVTVIVSAFFTTFTGASGVTILALGGLLHAILHKGGQNTERFSIGLLTASGSVGLVYPPSLAVIFYGSIASMIYSSIDSSLSLGIKDLFIAGLIPGTLMIIGMVVVGFLMSNRKHQVVVHYDGAELLAAFKDNFLELLLPVLIVILYFSGVCSLTETAAFAVVYSLFVEGVVKKEITPRSFKKIVVTSMVIIGGVKIIIALAQGLRVYLVLNGVPDMLKDWMLASVSSPYMFLLLLNVVLLLVGCFMDLYAALLIVVPLIIPVATAYGIHPIHLAMIFLSNLGVGFIMPPTGMNLFLSAYRFGRPLVKVYRDVLPFMAVQIAVVLLITYIPWLSTVFVSH